MGLLTNTSNMSFQSEILVNTLFLLAGILSHIVYFNRSEHHLYGYLYLRVFGLLNIATPLLRASLFNRKITSSVLPSILQWTSYLVGVYTSLLIYRILFHPLKNFPGPWPAKVSSLWFSSQVSEKLNAHEVLQKLHQEYGEFVRIGSSDLSISSPKAMEEVYGYGSKCTKAARYDRDFPSQSMHGLRSKAAHDKRRRVWGPAFNDKSLRGYEERIGEYGDELILRFAESAGQPIDVSKWFSYYSFDVVADLAFGKSFGLVHGGENGWIVKLIDQGMESQGYFYPPWLTRLLGETRGSPPLLRKFSNFCSQMLEERVKTDVNVPDIMSSLLEPFRGRMPDQWETEKLNNDAKLIIVAGSDTLAVSLTFLLYHLAREPKHLQKIKNEVLLCKESNGSFLHQKLQHCEHLNGCINEALRLHAPVPSSLYRLTPPEGIYVGDKFIPGSTTVTCPQWVIGKDENAFVKAEQFLPERWYSQRELIEEKSAFAPFSLGSFSCIGKPLALLELRTLIAKLLTSFDIELASGEDGENFVNSTRDRFSLTLTSLYLTFKLSRA